MDATFTKLSGRYEISVRRSAGHALAPRNGPGFNDAVPHDVAHLFVEIEGNIRGAVYGRLAAADGDDGMFWPIDPDAKRKSTKNRRQPTPQESDDMALSERLASLSVALWEVERGRRKFDPAWPGPVARSGVEPALLNRLYARYDEFADQWAKLPTGQSLTVAWPFPEGSGQRRRVK